jgi:beta-carotene hydroxylase
MLVNGVLAYAAYMPLHEATHNNVQGNHPTWRWLNDCVGWAGSLPLMFTFRGHQMSHMRHHAFTNDPKRDPDHFISGSIQELPRKLFELSVGQFAIATLGWRKGFEGRLADLDKGRFSSNPREARLEFHTTRRTFTIQLAFLVASSLAGYFPEVLFLYYLPSRIGLLGIMFTFAWFPHHPAIERGRYRDTRVTLFPGSGILFAGHDRHVVHHMLPRVPHYRIPPLFAALRPMLEERGVRIEGRLAGPGAPPVLLRPDPRIDQIRSQAEV